MRSTFYYREHDADYSPEKSIEADWVKFEPSHVVFYKNAVHGGPPNFPVIEPEHIIIAIQNNRVHDLREVVNEPEKR